MIRSTTAQITRPPFIKIIIAQLLVTLFLSALAWCISVSHGYSALLGGLICSLPNAWFVYRSFVYQGAKAAKQIVDSFYKAEAVKLALTALLFAVTFKYVVALEALTLFIVFFLVQMVHWFTPLFFDRFK